MNYAALWHEATQRYCYCLEPGRFLFRLQTAKDDLKSVTLHTLDKYLPLKIKQPLDIIREGVCKSAV